MRFLATRSESARARPFIRGARRRARAVTRLVASQPDVATTRSCCGVIERGSTERKALASGWPLAVFSSRRTRERERERENELQARARMSVLKRKRHLRNGKLRLVAR